MPRFQFVSPGAIAVDAITQVLAEREAKRRQDMLDALTMKKANREDEIQREQLASIKEQRQVQNEARQLDMGTKTAALLKPGQVINDQTEKNLGPLAPALVKSQTTSVPAVVNPIINPDMSVSGGTQATGDSLTTKTYSGTDKQLTDEEHKKQLHTLIDDPRTPLAVRQALQYEQSTGRNAPSGMFDKPKHEPGVVGEYEYYVEQEKAAGRKPVSFNEYQTMDANRHKSTTVNNFTLDSKDPAQSQALDMVAKRFAQTGDIAALGRGGLQSPFGQAVMKRAAQYNADTDSFVDQGANPNVPDLALNKGDYQANMASLKTIQGNLDAVSAFTRTADRNAGILRDAIKNVPDTGIPLLNKPLRAIDTNLLGSSYMTRLHAIRQSVNNEYAKIISNPNLNGVMTDSARHEMDVILSDDSTPAQINEALDTLQQEAENREAEYANQRTVIRQRMRGAKPKTNSTPGGTTETPAERAARLRKAAGL